MTLAAAEPMHGMCSMVLYVMILSKTAHLVQNEAKHKNFRFSKLYYISFPKVVGCSRIGLCSTMAIHGLALKMFRMNSMFQL